MSNIVRGTIPAEGNIKGRLNVGGGMQNYNRLTHKPSIEGVELIGDKSLADLHLNDYVDSELSDTSENSVQNKMVTVALGEKVDKVEGKGLSTEDYSTEEKNKLSGIAAGAEVNVQSDWNQTDNTADDYIKNKPDIPPGVTVDDELSLVSENPVQNKIITASLNNKANTSDLGTAAAKDSTNAVTADSTDLVESGAVKTAIDNAVSSAYHHAGTKTVAELTASLLIADNEGNVYNITDSGTTTSDFIEGAGKPIKVGDNVGICKVGNDYKFDLLSGFVDTSNFVEKSNVDGLLKSDGTVDTNSYATNTALNNGLSSSENLLRSTVGWTGKNLLHIPLNVPTSHKGITLTYNRNGDGEVTSIVMERTSTSPDAASFELISWTAGNYPFSGDIILSGCPSGGGSTTYRFELYDSDAAARYNDTGSGVTVPYNSVKTHAGYIRIRVWSTFSGSAQTFYPMVRLASISEATFEPYHESVEAKYEEELYGVNQLAIKLSKVKSYNTGGTWSGNSFTKDGVTYAITADAGDNITQIALSGSTASGVWGSLTLMKNGEFPSINTQMILSGSPKNTNSFYLRANIQNTSKYDYGDGIILDAGTVVEGTSGNSLLIQVHPSTTIPANCIFKPMLRKAEIDDPAYRPYNEQSIQNQLNDKGLLGAKNLLKNEAVSTGIFTVNADGSVTVNTGSGGASGNQLLVLHHWDTAADFYADMGTTGPIAMNGCVKGGDNSGHDDNWTKYNISIIEVQNTSASAYVDGGDGTVIPAKWFSNATNAIEIRIRIASGQVLSNAVFYPMLRLASDPDSTYQPYAMTNKELTDGKMSIADLKTVVAASSDFTDFQTRMAAL